MHLSWCNRAHRKVRKQAKHGCGNGLTLGARSTGSACGAAARGGTVVTPTGVGGAAGGAAALPRGGTTAASPGGTTASSRASTVAVVDALAALLYIYSASRHISWKRATHIETGPIDLFDRHYV